MNNLIWTYTITFLVLFSIIGCKKNNKNQEVKLVPVKYYLSEEDKSLLDYFYDHKTITFSDQNNVVLTFKTDSLYSITKKKESILSSGEELIMQYTCLTEYFPNYSFVITLLAMDTSSVRLEIMFATGTYWNDSHNDYVTSGFTLDPNCYSSLDTTFPNNHILEFNYYDTLNLESKQFYKVYHMWDDFYNHDIHVTTDCYYTNDLGVIAFQNLDGKFWLRNTE